MAKPSNIGRKAGEDHHKAELSSEEVELIRSMYEEGFHSYRALAVTFEVHKATIADIVKYRRRARG
jgi:predicted DNA-binding protein (UPF0251 family)